LTSEFKKIRLDEPLPEVSFPAQIWPGQSRSTDSRAFPQLGVVRFYVCKKTVASRPQFMSKGELFQFLDSTRQSAPKDCRTKRNQAKFARFREDIYLFYNLCLSPAMTFSIFDTGGPEGWGIRPKSSRPNRADLMGLLLPLRSSDFRQSSMENYLPIAIGGTDFAIAGPAYFANYDCQSAASLEGVRSFASALKRSSLKTLDTAFERNFIRRHGRQPTFLSISLPRKYRFEADKQILYNYEPGRSFPFHKGCGLCF